jgi:hypothetical protein
MSSAAPQNISAMTDISANIFSLLILILIIVLAARAQNGPRTEAPPEINIEEDLAGVERSPLSSGELFELLYERNEKEPSIKIDLFDKAIDVVINRKTRHFNSVEDAVSELRQLAASFRGAPLGVYVFSNRFYRRLTESLKGLGCSWREVSVPEALRNFQTATNDWSWSAGFSELIAGPADRARFRVELARLLESLPTSNPASNGGADTATVSSHSLPIVQTLLRWSRAVFRTAFLFAGFAFVVWVEIRHRQMQRSTI